MSSDKELVFVTRTSTYVEGKAPLDICLFTTFPMVFPKLKSNTLYRPIQVLLQKIEDLTGLKVFLEYSDDLEECNQMSEEIILATKTEVWSNPNADPEDSEEDSTVEKEYFSYLHTPFGTYFFVFFEQDKETGKPLHAVDPPDFTLEIAKKLGLKHAQTIYDEYRVRVVNVIDLDLPFPPLLPNAYDELTQPDLYAYSVKYHTLNQNILRYENAKYEKIEQEFSEMFDEPSPQLGIVPYTAYRIYYEHEKLEELGYTAEEISEFLRLIQIGEMSVEEVTEETGAMFMLEKVADFGVIEPVVPAEPDEEAEEADPEIPIVPTAREYVIRPA